MSDSSLWLLIFGMGAITFAIRAALILGQINLPPLLRRGLRFVPFAVLTAIFVPELLYPSPTNTFNLSIGNLRLIAGLLAIGVAWRTKNVLLTIIVGMGALWILQAILK